MPTDEPEILPELNADPEPQEPETNDGPEKSPFLRGDDEDVPPVKQG